MPNPRFIDWIKEKLKIGEAELFDKWLDTHRGMGTVCEKEVTQMTKQQGTRIIEARNWAEASAYGNRATALDILAERPAWVWLLPWNVGTWLHLRRIVRDCSAFLRVSGREDML